MAETMQNNLEGQITILKSQLQELAISFGDILMPAIRQIVSWIQGLVDKLNGMDEGTKKTIVTIGLIVAAIGPALIVIGKVISSVGTIMTLVPKISGAIRCDNCRQGCIIRTEFSRTAYESDRTCYRSNSRFGSSFHLPVEYE